MAVTPPRAGAGGPGSPDTRAAILAEARALLRRAGVRRHLGPRGRRGAPGSTRRWCTTTSAPRTTCSSPRSQAAGRPARGAAARSSRAALDGAGERLLRIFLSVWDDEDTRLPLLALVRGRSSTPGGAALVRDGFLRMVLGPVGAGLGLDQPDRRMSLVASQLVGLVLLRYVLAVEPLASVPADSVVGDVRPRPAALPDGPLP